MISTMDEMRMRRWFNALVVCESIVGRIPEPYRSRMVNDPQTYFDGFVGYVKRHYGGRLIDESRLYACFWSYVDWLQDQDKRAEELVDSRPDLY